MTRVLNRFGLALVLWLTLVGVAQADVITVTRNDDRVGGDLRDQRLHPAGGDRVRPAG